MKRATATWRRLSTAIRYAIQNGARVINASWGSNDKSRALEEVIAQARQAGVLFVAAAGNENSDALFYPAAYPHVIAVAATDPKTGAPSFRISGATWTSPPPGRTSFRRFRITATVSLAGHPAWPRLT